MKKPAFLILGWSIAILSSLPICHAQVWWNGPNISEPRYESSGVLLQNGTVIIIGGLSTGRTVLTTCESWDLSNNSITRLASTNKPHWWGNAVLLKNGNVLVIGGASDNALTPVSDCELYNPILNRWITTGSLQAGRVRAAATLLNDGRVLVTGGHNSSTSLNSSEIYNPITGKWSPGPDLYYRGRNSHTQTLLQDGKVLITNGFSYSGGFTQSCEVYDPQQNIFTSTGSFNGPASGDHSVILLANGNAVLAGGWVPHYARSELYEPTKNTWTPVASLNQARSVHRTVLLPNSKVLLLGGLYSPTGQTDTYYSLQECEVFDPASNKWNLTTPLPDSISGQVCAVLPNGNVFVAGGGHFRSSGIYTPLDNLSSSYIFDPSSPSWQNTAGTTYGHGYGSLTLLNNGITLLADGGDCSAQPQLRSESFDYSSGTWSNATSSATERSRHTATLLYDGSVAVIGGEVNRTLSSSIERYSVNLSKWSSTASLAIPRSGHSASLLFDGCILVCGGTTAYSGTSPSGIADLPEFFDPVSNKVFFASRMLTPRTGHSATFLPNGNVLVAGGQTIMNGTLVPTRAVELFDPICDKWTTTNDIPSAVDPVGMSGTQLTNGGILIVGGPSAAIYSSASGTWRTVAAPNKPRRYHTALLLDDGRILVSGGSSSASTVETSSEIYDPIANVWTIITVPTPNPAINPGSALLPDGTALISGGTKLTAGNECAQLGSSRLSTGRGYSLADRSTIASLSTTTIETQDSGYVKLALRGSGFQDKHRGGSESYNGNYLQSATNYPLVRIRRIGQDRYDNDFTMYLPFDVDGQNSWSDSTTYVRFPLGAPYKRILPSGYYALSVIANGIPSLPVYFSVHYTEPLSTSSPLVNKIQDSCGQTGLEITVSSCYQINAIISDTLLNVSLTRLDSLPGSRVRITIRLSNPSQPGHYVLPLRSSNGFETITQGTIDASLDAPPSILDEQQDCFNRSYLTLVGNCYNIDNILLDSSNNVRMILDKTPPDNRIRFRLVLIDPAKPGSYVVRVHSSSGKETVSRGTILPRAGTQLALLSITENGIFHYPGTLTLNYGCDSVMLRNNSLYPISINSARLSRNIVFSLPPSQFPLVLQPGEQRAIRICFVPNLTSQFRDTLFIGDTCGGFLLPMVADGLPLNGSGLCVPVQLRIVGTKGLLKLFSPHPNPASDVISIPFLCTTNTPLPQCLMYDMMGREVLKMDPILLQNGSANTQQGNYLLNVGSLPNGMYIAVICLQGDCTEYSIMVTK